MLLWFVGAGIVAVWNVFHDPALDHRFLVVGLLLPDLVDGPLGGARFMHSVTASVVLLIALVLATIGRRGLRKQLLAVPIGTFLHLVLDGAFNDTRAFWWPFTGVGLPDGGLPSFERSLGLNVILELLGAGLLWWVWRRFGLHDPAARRRFVRTGHFDGEREPDVSTC